MDRQAVVQRINQHRLIAVVRVAGPEEAVQTGLALARAGVYLVEITFTVADAPEAIARLAREVPEITIGAGTVTSLEQAEQAIAAGARFVVSPVLCPGLVAHCHEHGVVCMIAGLTPTELFQAWQAGADFVKLFPAGAVGGPAYLRNVLAPLPELPLVPTGGVTWENFREYLEAGARAVGLGSALVPKTMVRQRDWAALTEHAARFVAALASQ